MREERGQSLKTLLDHFTSVQSTEIARAGDAILKRSIHDLVTSSQARFGELVRELESTFDPQAWKFICADDSDPGHRADLVGTLVDPERIWERASTIIGDLGGA